MSDDDLGAAVPLDGDRLREMEADALSPFASIRTRGVSALVAALRASWAEVERLREVVAEEQAHCTDERFRLAEERDEARAALAAAERTLAELPREYRVMRPSYAGPMQWSTTRDNREAVEGYLAEARAEGKWGDVWIEERIAAGPWSVAASRTAAADKENDR